MMNRFKDTFFRLAQPLAADVQDTRREYLLRVILLVGLLVTIPFAILYNLLWPFGIVPIDMPIALIIIVITFAAAFEVVRRGHWRVARLLPIVLTYGVATYVAYFYNTGIVASQVFTMCIIITAMLVRGLFPWVMSGIILLTIFFIETSRLLGLLPPNTNYIDFYAGSSLSVITNIILITAVIQYFTNTYRQAYQSAHNAKQAVEATNKSLSQQIQLREMTESQLAESLLEKETLLKEIHHRVKNNLQIIASLLYLQSRNAESEAAVQLLQDSYQRVRSMALVHEMLYQSSNLADINMADYIPRLVGHVQQTYRHTPPIQFDLDIAPIKLPVDTAVPCSLILNELITNAGKHAFPDGRRGAIRIGLAQSADARQLTVGDDGVGLPPALKTHIEAHGIKGVDVSSMGLNLVHQLVRQLNGSLHVGTTDGTIYTILF